MSKFISVRDIPQMLDELRKEKFFGSITIDFRSGEPILLRQEKTVKFEEGNTYEQRYRDNQR